MSVSITKEIIIRLSEDVVKTAVIQFLNKQEFIPCEFDNIDFKRDVNDGEYYIVLWDKKK
jgi:hypothetical protein